MFLLELLAFFALLAAIIFLPPIAQAKRERKMAERMKALRDADEIGAILDSETHDIRDYTESLRRHHERF